VEKPFSAYRGDEPYVFVCYAHEDSEAVFREIAWLNEYGVNLWYDEGISPGSEWTDELAGAIQRCEEVLYFVTPNSVDSEHCRRELNFAQEEGREVVAIHLKPTEVPAGLRLSLNNRQAIFKHKLSGEEYRKQLIRATRVGSGARPRSVAQATKSGSGRGLRFASVVAALITLVGGAWWAIGTYEAIGTVEQVAAPGPEPSTVEILRKSIAVLPLDNLSPNPEDAYFAAGIHEEILNQLTKIQDLSVIARTSVLQYEGVRRSISDIADELKVATIMEGSVRYAGSRVRVTAQLIDAATNMHLWSETYDRELKDVFAVESDIALSIAGALKAELSPSEEARIGTGNTSAPQAHANYLKAMSLWRNFQPTPPVREALDAAIEIDPKFAAALSYLAWVYSIESLYGEFDGRLNTKEAQDHKAKLARETAQRALALDSNQGLAHVALGQVSLVTRDWVAAQQHAERAYELNPNDYRVVKFLATIYGWIGQHERAIQLQDRAVELSPFDLASLWDYGQKLAEMERWNEAREVERKVIAIAPDVALGYASLAHFAAMAGDPTEARLMAEAAISRSPSPFQYADVAFAYSRIGERSEAQRVFDLASEQFGMVNHQWQFVMHLAIGQPNVALDHLERAMESGFPAGAAVGLAFNSDHSWFDPVRSDPRFDELVRRAKQPRLM
jgi:TolB-like protein/Tfp pilus assembly protein PilF